jgi:vanillate O-demethylase monooxygenase subunit
MGRVLGDDLECGYHGLVFDCAGSCVRVPSGDHPPQGAQVRSYPIEPRYGLLWMWMGDPALADPDEIFPAEHWGDPGWGTTDGDDMVFACNYLHITDNLLDPSHVAWVHPGSFAGDGSDETPLNVTIGDDGVTTWRWMLDTAPAPFYAPYLAFDGNCDRKQQYEVRYPSHALIKAYISPAGAGGSSEDGTDKPIHPDTFVMDSFNFLTPVDERRPATSGSRCATSHRRREVSRRFARVRRAPEEDRDPAGVAAGHGSVETPNVNLRTDSGGIASGAAADDRGAKSSHRRRIGLRFERISGRSVLGSTLVHESDFQRFRWLPPTRMAKKLRTPSSGCRPPPKSSKHTRVAASSRSARPMRRSSCRWPALLACRPAPAWLGRAAGITRRSVSRRGSAAVVDGDRRRAAALAAEHVEEFPDDAEALTIVERWFDRHTST